MGNGEKKTIHYDKTLKNLFNISTRHNICIAMKTQSEKLLPLFDAREVIDSTRPKKAKQGND